MNKEEALNKIKELQEFVKELDEKQEENYCVDFENIEVDNKYKNLIFREDCSIDSLGEGDGVTVDKDFVKFVGLTKFGYIEIVLKGSDKTKDDYNKILWGCGE